MDPPFETFEEALVFNKAVFQEIEAALAARLPTGGRRRRVYVRGLPRGWSTAQDEEESRRRAGEEEWEEDWEDELEAFDACSPLDLHLPNGARMAVGWEEYAV